MKRYLNRLNQISKEWRTFTDSSFSDESEERKANETEKNKIKDLIFDIKKDQNLKEIEKDELVEKSILHLAQSSGCVEDLEISEKILDILEKESILNQKLVDLFYENTASGRWD
ncbi:hypothetical protein RCC89_03800 [Cytophagaceae bacterium ABcell3]|nr:hypothetical protein RCC89_03800 [Cytophagaceae bacterium ABcell3]